MVLAVTLADSQTLHSVTRCLTKFEKSDISSGFNCEDFAKCSRVQLESQVTNEMTTVCLVAFLIWMSANGSWRASLHGGRGHIGGCDNVIPTAALLEENICGDTSV